MSDDAAALAAARLVEAATKVDEAWDVRRNAYDIMSYVAKTTLDEMYQRLKAMRSALDALDAARAHPPAPLPLDVERHGCTCGGDPMTVTGHPPTCGTWVRAAGPDPLDVEALAETLYRYYAGPSREHDWPFWQTRARNMLLAMAEHRARPAEDARLATQEPVKVQAKAQGSDEHTVSRTNGG